MSLTRAIAVGRDQVEGSTVTSDALRGFLLVFWGGSGALWVIFRR